MTVKVVIVERGGDLSESTVKNPSYDTLYKKAGFKKPDGFECKVAWGVKLSGEQYCIKLFARSTGKANTENKYDFSSSCRHGVIFWEMHFDSCR